MNSRGSSMRKSVLPAGTKELTFKEFLERLSHLKPGTTPSVLDFADLQKQLAKSSLSLQKRIVVLQKMMLKLKAKQPNNADEQDYDELPLDNEPVVLSEVPTDELLNELSTRLAKRIATK